jgi:hypothetical protein
LIMSFKFINILQNCFGWGYQILISSF